MSNERTNRDGGYGWIIVTAFFLIEILVDGIRFTFGLYFVEFLDEFGKGKGTTAWIGALMVTTYNICGPVFAFIVNKVGFRRASMIGGLITTIGYILSYFAPNVYFLFLTYGILPGFGFGLVFLAGTVTIGRYFLKKRALAIGISFCGSGVGTFIITPLVAFLIDKYSWRGSVLIVAGLAFNCCALSALYRPINIEDSDDKVDDITDDVSIVIENGSRKENKDKALLSNENDKHDSHPLKTENGHVANANCNGYLSNSNSNTHGLSNSPLMPRSFTETMKEQLQALDKNVHKGSHRSLSSSHFSHRSLNLSVLSQSVLGSNASFGFMFDQKHRMKESTLTVNSPLSLTRSARTIAEENGNVFQNSVIESMFPKALVTDTNFIILMTSALCSGIPSFIPFSMLPDYARFIGASSNQSAWLLSTIGIGGTISRIAAGYLSDMSCVHRLTLLGVCLLVLGVTTITAALVPIYEVLITYSTMFGIFFGALYVVQPMVLLEYFGEEYIGEVMGVMMCVYGVALFGGSPLAGWIFDITNSYTVSFLFAGIFFLLSGIINYFVLCTKSSRQSRKLAKLDLEIQQVDVADIT
ncbi:hypothetical protein ACF0H5_020943 [Mactra antiquata]